LFYRWLFFVTGDEERKHSPLTPSFQKFSVFERFLANFAPEFPENEGEKWQHLQPSPGLVAFP
jgi:hypothetical protein